MTARLVPDAEVARVIEAALASGVSLDVGKDYVRVILPQKEGESLADYIGPRNSRKAPR
jgi:phosphatidylserine/phosphatidylglycerophosphate/cardiolipin synthase-like enzyme